MIFRSSKTYGHEQGFSCTFRQWRANSHCSFLHGYALKVHIEFEAKKLDKNGWVVDFGSLKPIKQWIAANFDHKTLVAEDDPELDFFERAADKKMIDLNVVPGTGCEAFAFMICNRVSAWMLETGLCPRVKLNYVRVCEHDGNAASFHLGSD